MFFKRLLSGAILLAVACIMLYLGGAYLACGMCFVSLCALRELLSAFHLEPKPWYFMGAAGIFAVYLSIHFFGSPGILAAATVSLILFFVIYVICFPGMKSWDVLIAYGLMLYAALPLSCLSLLSYTEQGGFLVWLVLISSWGADTAAYCVGSLMGKHKLVPKLSPGKSVEGAVGGVLFSMVLGAGYGFALQYFGQTPFGGLTVTGFAMICGAASLLSIFGDLAASGMKRDHKLKDYADLIPGHGGVMDRIDSVIFTAPVVYYLTLLLSAMS